MRLHKILQFLGVFGLASLLLTACIKEEDHLEEMNEGTGDPFVKFLQAPDQILYFPVFNNIQKVDLFSLRKDASSDADLNQATSIKLTLNPALIEEYNDEHGTSFEVLPDSLYTLVNPAIKKTNNLYQVDFKPGDFAQEFTINLNGAKWDLSHTYALGFTLTDSANLNITEGKKNMLVRLGVKNAYHSMYQANGVFTHPTAGPRDIDELKELVTAGPNSVRAPLGDLGGAGYFMVLTINPDNTVTITPSGATPNIDQHWGPNYYDPATQSFHLHYSYNTAAPRIVEEVLVRK